MARDLNDVTLNDKYDQTEGNILISGNQALLRLPMLQRARDQGRGLSTKGFISGYRGSPLGGLDSAAYGEAERLRANGITFQPGVNEDLAATSVWGTQQIDALPGANVDGVFAMWYGKGPGVERSADAIRHGNVAGSHAKGGVLLVYGDDHPGKSSTTAHQSEPALAALSVPSLYPSDVQEFLRFGLLGWEMSRFTGLWTGFKCVNETVEQTATVSLDLAQANIEIPEHRPEDLPPQGININPRAFGPAEADKVVTRYRLPLVHRFVRANGIDRAIGSATPRIGLVTAGKSYLDTRAALDLLGLDEARMKDLGIGIWKVGCIWPLEPKGIEAFAAKADALLFVEEKRAFVEEQARAILYNAPHRPVIWGKTDGAGRALLPSDVPFEPLDAARALYRMMRDHGLTDPHLESAYQALAPVPILTKPDNPSDTRMPFFCSGCPHNTSTRLPDGSFGLSGIGCHTMVVYNGKNTTLPPTQMGGEGANWIGMAPFTDTKHVFQNLGDGTYFHSGLLAIRAAVSAGVNVTYKILYNDAVAMTGGQPIDGPISVDTMARQVLAEGVKRLVVVSDNPEAYSARDLPSEVRVTHRDTLTQVQEDLRDIPGTTAIIYEQTCAAEKRRRRKRGKMAEPDMRVVINDAVCEGCGDCSAQSGCVSILPKATPLGIKRQIDQSSCNKDFSCLKGFCPSFVTLHGAKPRKPEAQSISDDRLAAIPAPEASARDRQSIMITGIGGTGVVTVGAVLAMAAHLMGRQASVYDMTGLAQKNGAVFSHLKLGHGQADLGTQRIGVGEADLILAFDMMAAGDPDVLKTASLTQTALVANSTIAPGAFFQMAASEAGLPNASGIENRLLALVDPARHWLIDGSHIAQVTSANSIAINMMMVGYAFQLGHIDLDAAAIERAIELNGVAIPFNLRAFRIGRLLAFDAEFAASFAKDKAPTRALGLEDHAALVRAFGGAGYEARFRAALAPLEGNETLGTIATPILSRLMRYKDEYEVARLLTDPAFKARIAREYEGVRKVELNLAPPIFSGVDERTGRPKKRAFGPWMLPLLGVLARAKGLRGTALDPFGRSEERRMERGLIDWYSDLIAQAASGDTAQWTPILAAADGIRGFGPVKEASVARIKAEVETKLASL